MTRSRLVRQKKYISKLCCLTFEIVDLQLAIESFRKVNHEVLHARDLIRDFVLNNQSSDLFKALSHVQDEIEEKTKLSTKEADPSWFEGLDVKQLATKESVMRRKAQDRIKGYFYKTKDELTKTELYRSNLKARAVIDLFLDDCYLFLNGVDYFSCLFDRSYDVKYIAKKKTPDETDATATKATKRRRIDSETKSKISDSNLFRRFQVALCNDLGSFDCHGIWKSTSCTYSHRINPYSTRESAVLFQIYNLDHQAEISRTIFPSIVKCVEALVVTEELCAIHKRKSIAISTLTFFREIFTVDNLKLVHIVCHDKGAHENLKSKGSVLCDKCDEFKSLQKIKLKIA